MAKEFVNTNLYHVCVHKTGSQWIKKIFSDPIIFEVTKMQPYTYQHWMPGKVDERKLTSRYFIEPFPENRIITPLYIDKTCYDTIQKPAIYKSFCIIRDPRDILVSWYFSIRDTHPVMGQIPELRKYLQNHTLEEGLIYSIQFLHEFGLFDAIRSWGIESSTHEMLKVKFEYLTGKDKGQALKELFEHCNIYLNKEQFSFILRSYSFSKMKAADKNNGGKSHYRSGRSNEWTLYFNNTVERRFMDVTGDLVEVLGYDN